MQESQLDDLKKFFNAYTARFSQQENARQAVELKKQHTAYVYKNAKLIASALAWSQEEIRLGQAAALLHDIGRFPQITTFGTFNDYSSLDHGALGVEVLLAEKALQELEAKEQRLILAAVKWHNKFQMPEEIPADEAKITSLLRDADKLDILRIFKEYYPESKNKPKTFLEFDLPEGSDCSEKIAEDLLSGRMANIHDIKNINDLRLIKLSWIHDLTYPASKKLFKESGFLAATLKVVPDTPRIRKVKNYLENYLATIN